MKWHELARSEGKNTRHVMGISGGKDSAALAVYVKDQYPDIHDQMKRSIPFDHVYLDFDHVFHLINIQIYMIKWNTSFPILEQS